MEMIYLACSALVFIHLLLYNSFYWITLISTNYLRIVQANMGLTVSITVFTHVGFLSYLLWSIICS